MARKGLRGMTSCYQPAADWAGGRDAIGKTPLFGYTACYGYLAHVSQYTQNLTYVQNKGNATITGQQRKIVGSSLKRSKNLLPALPSLNLFF